MLSKSKRISRTLFRSSSDSRKYYKSKYFLLRIGSSEDDVRVSVSVSKKISKKAVIRNKIRRRVYSVIREFLPKLSNNLYLLTARPGAEKVKGEELKIELLKLIRIIKN
ncbi:MAG: ribonuclease P protein component [Patescibacteria group bacterium]